MIIYQVFTRLFGNGSSDLIPNGTKAQNGCGTMADFTHKALEEIRSLGATHIWYTGIIEHATQTNYAAYGIARDNASVVKGKAGSPYAIKDYFDVDPDLATDVTRRMEEFEALLERSHQADLKVIIDFVPNHVARQYHSDVCPEGVVDLGAEDDVDMAFSAQNNFYYIPGEQLHTDYVSQGSSYREFPAKATGNDVFSAWPNHNDWYETIKLNYGVDYCGGRTGHFSPIPQTWKQMTEILRYWASKGIDGFRCDMAEMVPVEFWEWAIPQIKSEFPHIIFIAEVYNPAQYRDYIFRGKFNYLYDKVGLYDTLRAVAQGYASAHCISHCWQQVGDIRGNMLSFLENHDEQRVASDFFVGNPLRGKAPLIVSMLMDKNPGMIYFGQELGEKGMDAEGFSGRDGRTTIFDYWSVSTIRRWRNRGAFNDTLLAKEEQQLRLYYQKVLKLKEEEQVFTEGSFYDLMYVNPELYRQYAFVRHHQGETALIVVNFAETDEELELNLPHHLFEYLQLESVEDICTTDLLTDKQHKIDFSSAKPVRISVPAWGGVVLKITNQE